MQVNNGVDSWVYTFLWTEADFQGFKLSKFGVAAPALLVPPVWPGLAHVTMLSPVDITVGFFDDRPCDGVIVHLVTTPPDKPHYFFGSEVSVAHIGQLSFQSDDEDNEYPQAFSFTWSILVPKTMAHADLGYFWRVVPGVTGTITPWVIT
jgi:hypothetical protein